MSADARRVVARYLLAAQPQKVPVYNKKKERVVYVLPETLKDKSEVYEDIPEDEEEHVRHKGKPHKPDKPRRPRKPHRPEVPRGTTPAPVRPPIPKPVPEPPPVFEGWKPYKLPKNPMPTDEPRRWKVKRPKYRPASVEAVVARYLGDPEEE